MRFWQSLKSLMQSVPRAMVFLTVLTFFQMGNFRNCLAPRQPMSAV